MGTKRAFRHAVSRKGHSGIISGMPYRHGPSCGLRAVHHVTAKKKSRKNNPLSPNFGSSYLTALFLSAFFVVLTILALPEAR